MLHVPNGSVSESLGRLLSHGGKPSLAGFLLALGKGSLLLTHLSKDFGPDRVVEATQLARSGGMRNSLMLDGSLFFNSKALTFSQLCVVKSLYQTSKTSEDLSAQT
jgi:hypothetical protein